MYSQLEADAEFLKSVNVMDYSLLLTIEQIKDIHTVYRLDKLGRNEFKSNDEQLHDSMIYHVTFIHSCRIAV